MPTISDLHRAVESYIDLLAAERRIKALQAEVAQLENIVRQARERCDAFEASTPSGRKILDAQIAFLRRSGLLASGTADRKRPAEIVPMVLGAKSSRTAAATAAAAAKRRALRETNFGQKQTRPISKRLELFDEGFMRGFREYAEDQSAQNPYVKGDRSRGWRLGAQKAGEDIAAGIIPTGVPITSPTVPTSDRAAYQAELIAKAPAKPDVKQSSAGKAIDPGSEIGDQNPSRPTASADKHQP